MARSARFWAAAVATHGKWWVARHYHENDPDEFLVDNDDLVPIQIMFLVTSSEKLAKRHWLQSYIFAATFNLNQFFILN